MLEDREIARLLDVAAAACHTGMVAEARTILSGILAARPGFVPARIVMALSHAVIDEFDKAVELLDAVLGEYPQDADALAVLGLVRTLTGERDAARETFARISGDSAAAHMAQVVMREM